MIETDLSTFLTDNLDSSIDISWGKIAADFNWADGVTSVNFFKLNQDSAEATPSYLDNFQVTVRNKYIDAAQQTANDIITLFHRYYGDIGSYKVTVTDVTMIGVLYEQEDIVSIPINLGIKYTII